jgi:hypothetical protein
MQPAEKEIALIKKRCKLARGVREKRRKTNGRKTRAGCNVNLKSTFPSTHYDRLKTAKRCAIFQIFG